MHPTITIIVPAYQVAHLISDTIHSVLVQTRTDWELLIIDDGSTDNLCEVVAPFLSDPRIQLHRFANGGLASARNRGIQLARGRFIALLDGDDMYEPEYLERMSAELERDPSIAFVSCDATMFGVPEREGRRFSEFEPQNEPISLERILLRQFNVFVMCMIRADAARAAGGFTTELRAAEDLDLWIRLLATGGRAAHVNAPLARYRRRAGSLSNSPELLLRSTATVYFRTLQLLGQDHPAASICRLKLTEALAQIDLWYGEQALRDGDLDRAYRYIGAALRILRRPRWRLMLILIRVAPLIARTLFSWRETRLPDLAKLARS